MIITFSMDFFEDAYKFLVVSGYPVSRSYVKEWMQSHPNYPALISFTDLLDEFQITHKVIRVATNSSWEMLPERLFIHFDSGMGETGFRIVQKNSEGKFDPKDLVGWTGITLFLDESSKLNHPEHLKVYSGERNEKITAVSLISALILLFSINQFFSTQWVMPISFMLFSAGFFFSILIVSKEIGLKSNVSEFFCKADDSGCGKILHSKYGKFGRYFSLGDLALIYFGGSILYISMFTGTNLLEKAAFLSMAQIPGLLFTPLSIYYQTRLKSFCPLCSALLFILWLQAINLFGYAHGHDLSAMRALFTIEAITRFLTPYALVGLWLILKPKLIQNQSIPHQNIMLRKWRQNPLWFDALLPLHKKVDTSPWNMEISYGNPAGVLQFLIVSNPFCDHCAIAHKNLERILDRHPTDIGVRIRFYLKRTDLETRNEKFQAILKILNVYLEKVWTDDQSSDLREVLARKIIRDWYELGQHQWEKDYVPITSHSEGNEALMNIIQDSIQWCNQVGIDQTPAFFVNGHEMPNPHTFHDVFLFATDYIQILKHKRELRLVKV